MVPFGPREVLSFPGEAEDEMKLYALTKDGLEVFRKVSKKLTIYPRTALLNFRLSLGTN
mgnify:CR=1 FL=1